ncbi:MAG TPA: hypothetical protein ENH94_07215 [Phycisphaerales bacterium]|nr:hypothetical protein [Phycisphaerales bacterium]
MKETKTVIYRVTCPNDPEHVIEKSFEVEVGSEPVKNEGEVYCPDCNEFVSFEIDKKVVPDAEILKILRKHNL